MKSLIKILCLILFPSLVLGQWVGTGGPVGGLGYNIKIHPTNPGIIFINDAHSGVHVSYDGGIIWTPSNNGITTRTGTSNDEIPVFSLAIDKNNPDIIWVGTMDEKGIFKSTDGGITYTKMDSGIVEDNGLTIRDFAIYPNRSDTVFASGDYYDGQEGTEFSRVYGVIYRTYNGGQNWTKIYHDSSLARWICINSDNPENIIVGTGIFDREAINNLGVGIIKSTDGGNTWARSNTGITNSLFVGGMDDDKNNSSVAVIGTGNVTENQPGGSAVFGSVYKSTDFGNSWTEILGPQKSSEAGSGENIFTATEFAPSNSNIIYAANNEAVYRSDDGGTNWTTLKGPNDSPWGAPGVRAGFPIEITVHESDPLTVFIANYGGGVFKSEDGGVNWNVLGTGYTGAIVHGLAVSSNVSSIALSVGRSGPFRTADGGENWAGVYYGETQGIGEWYSGAIDPDNDDKMLIADECSGNILRSIDKGTNWKISFTHPDANPGAVETRHGVKELHYAPSNTEIVYAGYCSEAFYGNLSSTTFPTSYGVYRSTNGGIDWTEVNDDITGTNKNITAMAVDPSGTNVLYIGIRGSGIFRTGNGGENWTYIGSNLIDLYVNGIGVSNSNADVIYIATRDSGVYKTTDGGTNWTQVLTGKIDSGSFTNKQLIDLVIDPKNDDNVFVADMRTGVYQTTDGGTNWELIDNGLTNRSVNCLAISSDGTVVYAGTNGGGVFVLGTPTGLEDNLEFSNYDLQIYPNPFSNNTTVHYSLSKESNVILRVFSINGELVKIIDEGNKPQGAHNYYLSSEDLPPGSYLIQLTTQEGASETKKIILTK